MTGQKEEKKEKEKEGKEAKKKENCRERDGRDLRLYERSSPT